MSHNEKDTTLAAPTAKGGTITNIWHVVICLPGLDTNHYLASDEKPSHAQIEAFWRTKYPRDDRPLRPRGWSGPLRDAYPGLARVEQLEVRDIRPETAPAGAAGGGSGDLHGRAWVAAEYRIAGSPHEWTDEDALAMARYILAGPAPTPDLAGQGERVADIARSHAISLEQCSLFVDRPPLRKSMTDAAAFLRAEWGTKR